MASNRFIITDSSTSEAEKVTSATLKHVDISGRAQRAVVEAPNLVSLTVSSNQVKGMVTKHPNLQTLSLLFLEMCHGNYRTGPRRPSTRRTARRSLISSSTNEWHLCSH
eukprot:GEZU01021776.1.p1 GENE.GEZU01021776.1~~GEZU01021776.1.p1  ORF type:complete len:109 (+),score=16.25 GEZU01021776.1:420-746(+)